MLAWRLRLLTGADRDRVLAISYPFRGDIDTIVPMVVDRIEARWPSDDPERTTEVDVVGISMGGLIARAAEAGHALDDGHKLLNINRLYTLATPHRGATLANHFRLDPAARDMKPGSEFLEWLNAELEHAEYDLICYARLHDGWVGATNTAPPGHDPIWLGGLAWGSHFTITQDRRILADIALRLRNEEPIAPEPSPPPHD